MLRIKKVRSGRIFGMILVLIIMVFSVTIGAGQVDSGTEVQKKMVEINNEERAILRDLFALTQEIKEMEKEEEQIFMEKQGIAGEIEALRTALQNETIDFEKKKDILEEVLKSYQRKGPGTYLEIILDSDNLTTLLRRMNALRDLTRNTGELLRDLEASKEKLSMERSKLEGKLALVEEQEKAAAKTLAKRMQRLKDLEIYVASLKDEKDHYKEQLGNIEKMWQEFKRVFTDISNEFSSMIESDKLPPNAIKMSISLFGIKGYVEESVFNNLIPNKSRLPKLNLQFYPGRVKMDIPEKNLVLTGTFSIVEGNKLQFNVDEGSFYGFPLGNGAIDELMEEGYPILDLKPLLGNYAIKSLQIVEGKLEFVLTAKSL
jgi:peptidoglycan hydrolase CwlO-like protein